MRNTPDMTGKCADITDPHLLFERIGYRIWLAWSKGDMELADFYDGYNQAELRRLTELRTPKR